MRVVSATALAIACAGACVAPSYDIVESLGDAGESGAGDGGRSGSSSGGRSANGGSVSTGGASTGGDGGEDPGSGGGSTGGVSGNGEGGSSTGGKGGTPPTGGGPTGGGPPTGGDAGGPPTGGRAGGPPLGGAAGGPPLGGASGGPPMGGAGGTVIVAGGSGGGPMVGCDMAFTVSSDGFVRAPGASCWFGYAYAGGDVGSTVMPTSFATCGQGCMLRSSGTVGPATQANSFAGVAYLGVNVNQAAGTSAPLLRTPVGNALVVTWTKALGPAIRVQIHGSGADRWCANLTTSPQTIPYSSFNTQCWDNMGLAYNRQPIQSVQLVAPGGATAQPFDWTLVSLRDQ